MQVECRTAFSSADTTADYLGQQTAKAANVSRVEEITSGQSSQPETMAHFLNSEQNGYPSPFGNGISVSSCLFRKVFMQPHASGRSSLVRLDG